MPVLRNRLVLRMARGLTGFVSFEAGLTRGIVPDVEHPAAQVREFRDAREKLEKRDRQLSKLKAQLAHQDKKILELNRRSKGRLAGKVVGAREEVRLNELYRTEIAGIRRRLYALGFVDRAIEDLQNLVADSSRPVLRRLATWELALWHANQYSDEGAQRCLELLPVALQGDKDPAHLRRAAVIEAECQEVLGDIEAAKRTVSQALAREPHADLFLARANLENSASARMEWINRALQLYSLPKVSYDASAGGPLFDSIKPGQDKRDQVELSSNVKVSVIIPAYNAEDVIRTALDSILSQTWANLEVLVVDDCSTDATVALVEAYVRRDSRVRLIRAEANRGTYVARNLALRVASGEFVTCHDADDWSHPEKIERQVRHLLNNPSVIGNSSQHARATADLKFFRRGNSGFYIYNNVSSLMFRRESVMKTVGYWDCVRFSADSEFQRRVKKAFGDEHVVNVPTGPLSLLRQSSSSLTGNAAFGIHASLLMGVRKEHFEAYTHFHDTAENLFYEFPQDNRPFAVPEPMWPIREAKEAGCRHFDVILASDFRLLGDSTLSNVEEIKAQKQMGLRTGLIQMSRYDHPPNTRINPMVRELLDGDVVQMLVYGEKVSCDVLVLSHPPSLHESQRFVPDVEAESIHVIVNQTPISHYSDGGRREYDIGRCEKHLRQYFGKAGVWHPIDPSVRRALFQHHSEELKDITLASEDWSNMIDVTEWWRERHPLRRPGT